MRTLFINSAVFIFSFIFLIHPQNLEASTPTSEPEVKEWTLLVFLNGHNNLDSFGTMNLKQMEQVGSSKDINVVVQWASYRNKATQRLYIVKDTTSNAKVISPVIEEKGIVDMGNWHSLVEFVDWGVKHYPAKHYFIDVWDHGTGWHRLAATSRSNPGDLHLLDISFDDRTGHSITTSELGLALAESAKIIGHKVDLYGSDACLMAMAEIADEASDSVQVLAGSEEVEPGEGWPYHDLLKNWVQRPDISPTDLGALLTQEYIRFYKSENTSRQEGTFSALHLEKIAPLNEAISEFGKRISQQTAAVKADILKAAKATQTFTYDDYADLVDFIDNLKRMVQGPGLDSGYLESLKTRIDNFIILNQATSGYPRAHGLSIWLPTSKATYDTHLKNYQQLKFHKHTNWGNALASLFQ